MAITHVEKITDRIHAYIQLPGGWWLSNAGIVTGKHGFVLVDTASTRARVDDLLDAAREATGQEAASACVLTHPHGDHAGGLSVLEGARIYSGPMAAENLASYGLDHWPMLFPSVEWGAIDAVVPDTIVPPSDSFDVDVEEAAVPMQVRALSTPAHSVGDCVAWLPEDRVLFAGDLVWWGVTPLCVMGSIQRWRDNLDALLDLSPRVVVPGHGMPADERSITRTRDYLDEVIAAAQMAVRQGWSVTETVSRVAFPSVTGWLEPERHVVNLHHAIAEMRGQQIDVSMAVRNLITAHGGQIPVDL